jgi:hypothetical protein
LNYKRKFATDIVEIEDSGKRFLPKLNEKYPIFDEKVFNPIVGVVFKIVNNIEYNVLYCGNYTYNTGSTIVIKDENLFLLMGHLRKGAIRVNVGDIVE